MEVKSAADLLSDSTFLAFCERWKEEGRAPFPLSDYLRDWDLWEQAEVADWAHRYKDRVEFGNLETKKGPTPRKDTYRLASGKYSWWTKLRRFYSEHSAQADDLEVDHYLENDPLDFEYFTFPEAIAALLDHYRPVSRPEEVSGGKE